MSNAEATGVGSRLTLDDQSRRFIAHIIRDLIDPPNGVIYYGNDFEMINVFRSPEFGMETWGLNSSGIVDREIGSYNWIPGTNPYYSKDFANLILPVNYDIAVHGSECHLANGMVQTLKYDAPLVAINPGLWASDIGPPIMRRDTELENELKRYSMLATQDVRVYRK